MEVKSKKNSFNILQILPALNTGGVERGTIEVATFLQKAGHKAFVSSAGGFLVEELYEKGITHLTLPLASKNPWVILTNAIKLIRVIRTHHIDIIHARSRAPAWSAYIASRITKCPLVTTFHGTYNFKNPIKKFYNSIMVRGDQVIAISNFIKCHILENYHDFIREDLVTVVDRSVDISQFSRDSITQDRLENIKKLCNINTENPILLMPGRLTRWKGQIVTLEAVKILVKTYPNLLCLFVGPDQGRISYLVELKNFVNSNDIANNVRFIASLKDMPAIYSLVDLCIHASTDPEAFGRVIIEAQALETPVIASALGAPLDIIEDRKTGWLHQPGNSSELAEKILEAISLSPQEKQKITQEALKKVREYYTTEQLCEKTLQIYKNVLSKSKNKTT
jgi:glycosyltransferase involved in cell wall biosynthesis